MKRTRRHVSEGLQSRRLRRFFGLTLSVALVAGLGTLGVTTAGAMAISGIFQLDGNPQDLLPAAPDDWQTLLSGGTPADAGFVTSTAIPVTDSDVAPQPIISYFTGGGSKDVRDISSWQYSSGDVAPDKDDILNAFAAAYRSPATPDGDLIVFFGADRFANDGDSQIGFWFFKDEVSLANGRFTGVHSNDDVLVLSDFSQGGDISTIKVYKWIGGKNPLSAVNIGTGPVDCEATNHNINVCAVENDGPVDSIWPYTPKSGAANSYPQGSFLEGGINVTDLIGGDGCFASFMAETRSSTSPTAQLKDFSLGSFPVCAPSTTLTASPTADDSVVAVAGDTVPVTFTETNNGTTDLTAVSVTSEECSLAGPDGYDGNLAKDGSVEFSCDVVTTAGTAQEIEITGTGQGVSPLGNVTWCDPDLAVPDDTFCDQDEQSVANFVTIVPGTELAVTGISPNPAKSGDTVTFTITEDNDGSAPAGFESDLALDDVSISTGNTDCDAGLALGPTSGDDNTDGRLDADETWTYQCSVTISGGNDLTLTFTGSGTALKDSDYERIVTYCVDDLSGTLCDLGEQTSATVNVISPGTALNVTASAVITYTFVESNEGDAPLSPPTLDVRESFIGLAASTVCDVEGVLYTGGDTNGDKKLDETEEWTFTCKGNLAGPSADTGSTSVTIDGRGHGVDSTGDDITWCAAPGSPPATTQCDQRERDRLTVTIQNLAQG